MTSELEQEFYDTFGIEPKHNDGCKLADNYWNNESLQKQYKTFDEYLNINCTESDSGLCYSTCDFAYDDLKYPDITADKLLEMICILNSYYTRTMQCCTMLYSSNIATLKEEILKEFIDILKQYTELDFLEKDKDDREEEYWIKSNIQQLFKEEE